MNQNIHDSLSMFILPLKKIFTTCPRKRLVIFMLRLTMFNLDPLAYNHVECKIVSRQV